MPADLTLVQNPAVQRFLNQPLIARLATVNPRTLQPHVVPVWYEWDGACLWIPSSRKTRKISEILANPWVSVVVDTDSRGEPAQGVIFEGRVALETDPQPGRERGFAIYVRYLGVDGALEPEPQSWLNDPAHLLIRLQPSAVYTWGFSE